MSAASGGVGTARVTAPAPWRIELPAPTDRLWFANGDSHQGALDGVPSGTTAPGVGR
jgi:hypothetical protein